MHECSLPSTVLWPVAAPQLFVAALHFLRSCAASYGSLAARRLLCSCLAAVLSPAAVSLHRPSAPSEQQLLVAHDFAMHPQVFPVANARAREQVRAWARAAGWNTAATAGAASSSSAPAATAPLAIEALEGLLHASLDVLLEAVFKMELSEGEKEEFLARLEEALDEVSLRATDPLRCVGGP